MIKNTCFVFVLFISLFCLPSYAAVENYTFDPDHATVTWSVNHFGFSNVTGKFMANGSLLLDAVSPNNSKVNVTINIDSLTTGVKKLDSTLMDKTFFDLKEYPTAKFVSNKIEITSADSAKVYGTLTVRNIPRPLTLDVKLVKKGEHPFYHKKALGFTATAVINRSEFTMRGYIPGVSDQVKLQIQAEALLNYTPAGTPAAAPLPAPPKAS